MKMLFISLIALTGIAHGAAVSDVTASADGTTVDFTPRKKVVRKDFNLRVFPLSAIFYSAPHLSAEAAISRRWVLGFEGFYMFDYRYNSFLGDNYALTGYREAYFGPLTQFYLNRAFKGFYGEVGGNFVMAEVEYFNKYYYGNIGLVHGAIGYRIATKSGVNIGIAAGVGQYVGDPLEYGYNPTDRFQSPYVPRTFFRSRVDLGYSF